MNKKKRKICTICSHTFFGILFVIGFIIYFIYHKEHADIFVLFISISILYFFLFFFIKWLGMKKHDIKKEIKTGIIDNYREDIKQWKHRKEKNVEKSSTNQDEKNNEIKAENKDE